MPTLLVNRHLERLSSEARETKKICTSPRRWSTFARGRNSNRLNSCRRKSSGQSCRWSSVSGCLQVLQSRLLLLHLKMESHITRRACSDGGNGKGEADLQACIDYIVDGEKPLSFYVFTTSSSMRALIQRETSSGMLVFNDCLMQAANEDLPFGGVGRSGMGVSFIRFSVVPTLRFLANK